MSNRPYSLANLPNAPKKMVVVWPFSRLRQTPRRVAAVRSAEVRRLILPPTPPPPAPRKMSKKTEVDLTPIPIDWGVLTAEKEAQSLADSQCVRLKYLSCSPNDIEDETSLPFLERLWEMYFPSSQPRNAYEEAYLSLMRECIDNRMGLLRSA